MASDVDICNLALGMLGDVASVASINPPEGSPQAEHCARFYPIARDTLLERHAWGFATQQVQLALLGDGAPQWLYRYGRPSLALRVFNVLPPATGTVLGADPGADFATGVDGTGASVIYTNVEDALAVYAFSVSDAAVFPPLFALALAAHLAAMLAGPLIKGDAGAAEAKRQAAVAQAYLAQAILADGTQRRAPVDRPAAWIAVR